MTLYDEFIQTIKSTQNQKVIIENILNGQQYAVLQIKQDKNSLSYSPNVLKITCTFKITSIPDFTKNYIFFPLLNPSSSSTLNDYIQHYTELSLLDITYANNNSIYIDISNTLNNFKNNTKIFDTHKKISPENIKQEILDFINNYYTICNYLKEISNPDHKNKQAFIINFDSSFFKDSILYTQEVIQENFTDFDFLFFAENEENFCKDSGLIFSNENSKENIIDIPKTIEKIELYNSMKNF